MGRKRIYANKDNAYAERNRENARQYYYQHRDEILARNKSKKRLLKRKVLDVLKEWNVEIINKLQETLPQWLERALNNQLKTNNELINQFDEEQGKI